MRTNIQANEANASRARVFFALWPEPALQHELYELALRYQKMCGGRATREGALHLTLLFLGEVERTRLAQIQQAIDGLPVDAFSFYLQQFSCWRHNRIGLVAPPGDVAGLQLLSDVLRQVAADAGIDFDRRPLVPHVTLLRKVNHTVATQPIAAIEWPVDNFALVESVTTEQGVRYRMLQSWECRK